MPVSTYATEDVLEPSNEAVYTETAGDAYSSFQEDELSNQTPAVLDEEQENAFQYKEPISKRKLVKKFLTAMFAVVVFSILLYLMLSVYNKLRNGSMAQVKTPEGETPLSAPKNTDDAVKTFLDKTNWK